MKKTISILAVVCSLQFAFLPSGQGQNINTNQPASFTLEDRDRLIRMETTLEQFMKSTDKRFEAVDKRFEAIDNRMNNIILLFGGLVTAIIAFAL